MVEQVLFNDWCNNNEISLCLQESSGNGRTVFRGKFQEANVVNKNRRSYGFDILDENVKKLEPIIKNRGLIGECDHPADSILHFANASHLITKLWWEGNILYGEGELLNTPMGKVVKALLNDGVRVGISSRGVGNGTVNSEGVLVIGSGFKLLTFDVVSDPSTAGAFQEVSKKETCIQTINTQKTESRQPINKSALIAALGGVIKESVAGIKSKL